MTSPMTSPMTTVPTEDEQLSRAEAASPAAAPPADELTADELTADELTADDLIPDQPALALCLRDLAAERAPQEPPIWPVPWREEDAAPWWRRAWAHAQGTWIGTALAALLVLGVLGASLTLHLPPASPMTVAAPHPTTHSATPATAHSAPTRVTHTTPLAAAPAPHVTWQSSTTQSGSGGHGGHSHKRR